MASRHPTEKNRKPGRSIFKSLVTKNRPFRLHMFGYLRERVKRKWCLEARLVNRLTAMKVLVEAGNFKND